MAYDEHTAARFRDALSDHCGLDGVTEKRMMGGVCFLLNGNMIGGAERTKDGMRRFMFRVGKDNQTAGAAMPGAQVMEMGGRLMRGFFFVEEAGCDEKLLAQWILFTLDFVRALPPK